MSRYRSYGKLDDPFVTEGDTFFQRMNSRLRGSQLQPGEVALSQNGRMDKDGGWQPRKGLKTFAGAITIDADAIRLPFEIVSAERTNNIVTIITSETPNNAFLPGENITVVGVPFTGADDPNGTFTLSSVSYANKLITYAQSGVDESFTITASDEPLVSPGNSIATQLDFVINDQGANEVFGSTAFTLINDGRIESYVFTATNNVCQVLRLRDRTEYKMKYLNAQEITARCELVQAFDKIFIFRNNKTTLFVEPQLTTKKVTGGFRTNTTTEQTITITAVDHGRVIGDFVTIIGLGAWSSDGQGDPNGVYEVQSVPDADTLTVTFVNNAASGTSHTYSTGAARIEYFNDFDLVESGDYSYPDHLNDTSIEINDGGVATFSAVSHGLVVGDELELVDASTPLDLYIGRKIRVSRVPTDDTFEFILPVNAVLDSDNKFMRLAKKRVISHLIHMPAAPFAVLNQQRLWMPYFYTSDAIPTQRKFTDEIIASDILDYNTYDPIGQNFRVASGGDDYVVGLEPFTEDTLLIFLRKSIMRLGGVSGSLADTNLSVVTPELGCAARRTIVQVGNKVYFLSDNGVYGLEYLDQYNLRGLEMPLSEAINPTISRINAEAIDKAVGRYINNRLYFAVPVDGARENNLLIIYNLLNGGWESIDHVDSIDFNIRDMIVAQEGEKNKLYITTSEGGVHEIEGFSGGDQISVSAGVSVSETLDVESQLVTREYDADTIDRKVFSRTELHVESSDSLVADAQIAFSTTDPDRTRSAVSMSGLLGTTLAANEDASLRTNIRLRGYGCSVSITPTQGRPTFKAVKVDARITDRSTTSTT
jgi:hypothetical protein